MKTQELIRNIRVMAMASTDRSGCIDPAVVQNVKKHIDAYMAPKTLCALSATAKLGRLREKVLHDLRDHGCSRSGAIIYVSLLGLPDVPKAADVWLNTPSRTTIQAVPTTPAGQAPYTMPPPLPAIADPIDYVLSDGSRVTLSQWAVRLSDFCVLKGLIAPENSDFDDSLSAIRLTQVSRQKMDWVKRYIEGSISLDGMEVLDLHGALQAANYLGSDDMSAEIGQVLWSRVVESVAGKGFLKDVAQGLDNVCVDTVRMFQHRLFTMYYADEASRTLDFAIHARDSGIFPVTYLQDMFKDDDSTWGDDDHFVAEAARTSHCTADDQAYRQSVAHGNNLITLYRRLEMRLLQIGFRNVSIELLMHPSDGDSIEPRCHQIKGIFETESAMPFDAELYCAPPPARS